MPSSRIKDFYKLTPDAQRDIAISFSSAISSLPPPSDQVVHISENVVAGVTQPFSVATNFIINGHDVLLPFMTEESSVVAAASNGASKMVDGITACMTEPEHLYLQIQLVCPSNTVAQSLQAAIDAGLLNAMLRTEVDQAMPRMVARGGGARDSVAEATLVLEDQEDQTPAFVMLRFKVYVCDSFGANAVNSAAESISSKVVNFVNSLPDIHDVYCMLRILSNHCPERQVHATARVPFGRLAVPARGGRAGIEGETMAKRVVLAAKAAQMDDFRRATHNKGILNGVFAVCGAAGQDIRAISAALAPEVATRSLTTYSIENDNLVASIRLVMPVGAVGGAVSVLPAAKAALSLVAPTDPSPSRALAYAAAAAGLANNLAALCALCGRGIQDGHMRLHVHNILASLNIPLSFADDLLREAERLGVPPTLSLARETFPDQLK